VRLANWFSQNQGLVTAVQLIVGDIEEEYKDIEKKRREMDNALEDEGLMAFSEVDVVSDYECGILDIIQANGMADLQSNTVMFGWPKRPGRLESTLRIPGRNGSTIPDRRYRSTFGGGASRTTATSCCFWLTFSN